VAQAGRRVAAVGAVCPAEAPQKQIDGDGVKDVCIASEPPVCAPRHHLVTDAAGEADRCVADDPAAGPSASDKPSCPPALALKVHPGEDSCVATAKPVCAQGFHLSAKAREDFCEP
jgi:hypothetical protein